MKKILTLLTLSVVLFSCKNSENKNQANEIVKTKTKIDSSKIMKQEAINLLNEADGWVKKGVMKEVSTSKVNENINPLMKKYEAILSKLDKKDSLAVQEYRTKQINKMIDLQIQQ
nr:hypothetical protein [uncultured Flavobacterium sp.]